MWSTFDVATGIAANGAQKMYFVQIDNVLANACTVQADGSLVSIATMCSSFVAMCQESKSLR